MHLLLIGGSPKAWGGIEEFCERATEALQKRGEHRVDRIVANTAYLSISKLPAFIRGLILLSSFRRSRPDCVWLQYGNIADLAYLVFAKALGFTVMVTPHLGSNWRSQSNPALRALSERALRLSDRLALISKTQEQEILLPARVPRSYIRNFLPKILWSAEPPSSRPTDSSEFQLLHAGRLSEGKGTFLFVEVCEGLRKLSIPFKARIAGAADEPTMSRLREEIDRRGLQDSVAILGRVSDADLIGLLQCSDVLVHLSKIDSYPLIVLEAIAYCMFPICLSLAGARDMIATYAGYIVGERSSVKDTVVFLRQHSPSELWTLGRKAATGVRNDYSWDICTTAVSTALNATITDRIRIGAQ